MASFTFTSPSGQNYTVEGPEGATSAQAFQMLQQHLGNSPQPAATGLGEDAAKSAGSGLENLTASTLGLPGDLSNLLAHGSKIASDYLANKMGFESPSNNSLTDLVLNQSHPAIGRPILPTTQDILATASNPIVQPDYQPQTALGGVLKTGTEFLPAMIGGPESAATKLLTRVAAPTIASEGAGALTKGTAAEPYARMGAALLAGAGASKVANSMAEASAIRAATPALSDVKSEASNAYDALTSRNTAIPLAQSTLDNLAGDIKTTLNQKGIRPSTAQSIHNAVDEIKSPATAGTPDVADLVAARQNVKSLLSAPDANKAGAFVALGKIENAIEQSSPGTMASIREADKNYAAFKANEALDKRLARADLRAAGEHSGANVGNKIRQQVTNYLLSNEARYLSPETKADLQKIVKGTASQNTIRFVANLLGGGGGLGMLAGGTAGYEAGGIPGALAGAAAGKALKFINNRAVVKQAEQVAQNIRQRSPLGQQTPLALPPMSNPLLSGLSSAFLARPKQ